MLLRPWPIQLTYEQLLTVVKSWPNNSSIHVLTRKTQQTQIRKCVQWGISGYEGVFLSKQVTLPWDMATWYFYCFVLIHICSLLPRHVQARTSNVHNVIIPFICSVLWQCDKYLPPVLRQRGTNFWELLHQACPSKGCKVKWYPWFSIYDMSVMFTYKLITQYNQSPG